MSAQPGARQPDAAALDAALEELLASSAETRESRLALFDADTAGLLRRMLAVADDAVTADIAGFRAPEMTAPIDLPAPRIPGIRLLGEIGRGGMAVVYAGERDVHGTPEPVAVKLLAGGHADVLEQQRFLNEQRILAELKHPHIATLLDVGVAEGRAYMVMERIEGVPVHEACSPARDGILRVLDIIGQVAEALQAAHERLVIHRDIKPGNVLVDSHGRVKLIDFGIAKRLVDPTIGTSTATGAVPLTLRYASPEQLLGRSIGVGSDIFQLGLLAHVLLTGAWPFAAETEGGYPNERIRADALPVPASAQQADPRMRRALEGDLDAVIAKCLRHEPADRYRSVAEFAEDLRRWRSHRPVRARRQTRWYLAQRFFRRHRIGVGFAAAGLLLLLVTTAAALVTAQREREYAARSSALLATMTEVLAAGDPWAEDPGSVPIAEVLDRAERSFLSEEAADPVFQASVLLQLAEVRDSFRAYDRSSELLERAAAIADQHPLEPAMTRRILLARVAALGMLGRLGEAEALLAGSGLLVPVAEADADALAANLLHLQIRKQQGDRGPERDILPALAARIEDLPGAPPMLRYDVATSLALFLMDQAQTGSAQQSLDRAQAALDDVDRPYRLQVRLHFNRALVFAMAGQHAQAREQYEQALALAEAHAGPDHPVRLVLLTNYGSLLLRQRLYEQCYALLAPLEDQAGRILSPRQKSHLHDAVAVAALQTGRAHEAVAATVRRLGVMSAIEPRQRADIRPDYAAQTAWILFELGAYDLAKAWSEHQVPGESPGQGARMVSMISSELLGTTSPFSVDDLKIGCPRVQYSALRSALVGGKTRVEGRIPADCNPQTVARLQALGMTPGPGLDSELLGRTSDASPLMQRILEGKPAPELDATTRAALWALLSRLSDAEDSGA